MATQIGKWGNSLALRIPKALAEQAKFRHGTKVRVSAREGALVVSAARPAYRIEDLARRITPGNRHDETDWGGPLGREAW